MSDGPGPPHFRSLSIQLFSEPKPSSCWSVLRCGLCHSDLFSSFVTSWPLCLAVACCGYHRHPPPPTHSWNALPSSSNRASGSRAAEELNRSGMTAPPFRCVTWGGYTVQQWLSIVFRGQRRSLLSADLIIYWTAPSKLDSLVMGHRSQLICLWGKKLPWHALSATTPSSWSTRNNFFPTASFMQLN